MAREAHARGRVDTSRRIGWGEQQLNERARIATEAMRKYDAMPPEFRALVNEYGMKVRSMMRDGMTVDEIRDVLG